MRGHLLAVLFCSITAGCWAMGFTEDPGEVLDREFKLFPFTHLTLRGEVKAEIQKSDHYSVKIRTTRALFDQLSVFSFFGNAWIAVETGLRGPREVGPVKITISVPRLESLTILDNSSASVVWPSQTARVRLEDGSFVDLKFEGSDLRVEGNYRSTFVVSGSSDTLKIRLRNGSRVDARNLSSRTATLELKGASKTQLGPTASWEGTLSPDSTAEPSAPPPGTEVKGQ